MESRQLGRTGLAVGRLGVSASYGVPTAAVEKAFEHGVNYFYYGSMRKAAFGDALRNLAPQRDRFVLVVQSYSRMASLVSWSLERALRGLKFDYADVLLLGMWNGAVSPRVFEAARKVQERGLVKHIAVSTHTRTQVPVLSQADSGINVVHFRYNAAHPGAEKDIFPHLPAANRPGLVSFTATSWRQLLKGGKLPKGERVPTALDCYRFVLSRPEVDVCMTGPSTAAHMDEALKALLMPAMSDEELRWMKKVGEIVR